MIGEVDVEKVNLFSIPFECAVVFVRGGQRLKMMNMWVGFGCILTGLVLLSYYMGI